METPRKPSSCLYVFNNICNVILSEATLAPHAHLPWRAVPGSAGENLYLGRRDPSFCSGNQDIGMT
jgi:hypothetical protein